MVDISSALVSTLTGLVGVVIGASISNYVNHKIASQASRKDVIFKKKLDYFETIMDTLGKNTKMYKNMIMKLKNSEKKINPASVLKYLKKNRKKFEIAASPLYMDTRAVSQKIIKFVDIEKQIFSHFEHLEKSDFNADSIILLEAKLKELKFNGYSIIDILRKELAKK